MEELERILGILQEKGGTKEDMFAVTNAWYDQIKKDTQADPNNIDKYFKYSLNGESIKRSALLDSIENSKSVADLKSIKIDPLDKGLKSYVNKVIKYHSDIEHAQTIGPEDLAELKEEFDTLGLDDIKVGVHSTRLFGNERIEAIRAKYNEGMSIEEAVKAVIPDMDIKKLGTAVIDPRTGLREERSAWSNFTPSMRSAGIRVHTWASNAVMSALAETAGPEWVDHFFGGKGMAPGIKLADAFDIGIKDSTGKVFNEGDEGFEKIADIYNKIEQYNDEIEKEKLQKSNTGIKAIDAQDRGYYRPWTDEEKAELAKKYGITEYLKEGQKPTRVYNNKFISKDGKATNLPVGFAQRNLVYNNQKALQDLENSMAYVPDFKEAWESGDAGQIGNWFGGAANMVLSSVAPGMVVGLGTAAVTRNPALAMRAGQAVMGGQIVGEMSQSFNETKAIDLYGNSSPENMARLQEEGKWEFARPTALAIPAIYMENLGFKGIANAFLKKNFAAKDFVSTMFALGGSAPKETITELGQLGFEILGQGLAKNLKGEELADFVVDTWIEEAPEVALQSFFGTLQLVGAGRASRRVLKTILNHSPAHTRGVAGNALVSLSGLHQALFDSKDPNERAALKEEIKRKEKIVKENVDKGENIFLRTTKTQDTEIKAIIKKKEKVEKQIEALEKGKMGGEAVIIGSEKQQRAINLHRKTLKEQDAKLRKIIENAENQQIAKNKLGEFKIPDKDYSKISEKNLASSTKLQKLFDEGINSGLIKQSKEGGKVENTFVGAKGSQLFEKIVETQRALIEKEGNKNYSKIPKDLRIGEIGDYKRNLETELSKIIRNYDPSTKVPLGARIQSLFPKRAKSQDAFESISKQEYIDTIEAASNKIVSELGVEKDIDSSRLPGFEVSQEKRQQIQDKIKTILTTTVIDSKNSGTKLAKGFKDTLYNWVKDNIVPKNTKNNNAAFVKMIKDNAEQIYDTYTLDSMLQSTKEYAAAGFIKKDKNGNWGKVAFDPNSTPNKLLDWLGAAGETKQAKSNRGKVFRENLAKSIAAREAIELLESDIDFINKFTEAQKEISDNKVIQEIAKTIDSKQSFIQKVGQKAYEQLQALSGARHIHDATKILGLLEKITPTDETREAFQKAVLKAIEDAKLPSFVFLAANFANFARRKVGDKYVDLPRSSSGLYYGTTDPAFLEALAAAQKNDKNYPSLKKAMRVRIKEGGDITKDFIEKFNERMANNMDALEMFTTILQDAVHKHGVPLKIALLFPFSSYQATEGLIKIAAPFKYRDKKYEYDDESGKVKHTTRAKYIEEHNPPASVVGATIMWAITNNQTKAIFPFIRKNYYQTILSKKNDAKLDASELDATLPEGATILDNPVVRFAHAQKNGEYIDLNSIINIITGETLAQENNAESSSNPDGVKTSNDAVVEQHDKFEFIIDRAIATLAELTGSKGTLQMNLGAVPVSIIIGGLQTVKLAYQAGKGMVAAIEAGYKKVKDYMSIEEWTDLVSKASYKVKNTKTPSQVKLAIMNEKSVMIMQEQARQANENILKELGIKTEGLTTEEINNKLDVLRKAKVVSSNKKAPKKKARVFDFDDTLAKSKSKVLYKLPDGTEGSLDASQFAEQYGSLKEAGATFDYSEFNQVKEGEKGPLTLLAKKMADSKGERDIFVLTARPGESAEAIKTFLRAVLGISIPLKNITGLADGSPSAKAFWMAEKVSEGYNDIFFADDSKANVTAVNNMLNSLEVTNKTQVAKETDAPSLEDQMDTIIRDREEGPIKKFLSKLNPYVPPGADDFVGLLYKFLGKGKIGEATMQFFNRALLDPYAKAIAAYEAAKVSIARDYKALKKRYKNKRLLAEKILDGMYTKEQAVRAYLYDKAGYDLGMNETDAAELLAVVNSDPNLKAFADDLSMLTKLQKGYPKIHSDWLGGNIQTDLANINTKDLRKLFLAQWINNKNQVFSEQNLKLIKSKFGNDFTDALLNVLERMETGINRKKGKDKEFNSVMNWINNSVGAIMALNMRSAVLQQLSIVNFTNWNFNNPFMMAKAMFNIPQFSSDFINLWNSSFLVDRRGGLKIEINTADIADSNPGNLFFRINKKILSLGFKPTQWGDSFAIAFGGASWFRNRVDQLLKKDKPTKPQVIFLTGAAGSGKSTVAKKFGKDYVVLDKDVELQRLMEEAGLPADTNQHTTEQRDQWRDLQSKASANILSRINELKKQGKNIVIDDTGSSEPTLMKLKRELGQAGYESKMLLIDESLDTSLERNKARKEKVLTDTMVKNSFEALQKNRKRYREVFGDNLTETTSDEASDNLISKLTGVMTLKGAEAQAMLEFKEIAEETQQSSRPDRISRQQASDIGRLILAFANTPMQYARLTKKSFLDLVNGRGNPVKNVSKILWYGGIQNIIFTTLQQGLFSLMLSDDEDDEKEEKKITYALNSALDGTLRGMGYYGATIAAAKNLAMEYWDQYEKRQRGEYVRDGSLRLIRQGTSISPPISKKIGDIIEAQKFESWKQYKHDPFYQGFAKANYFSALTNIPLDRAFKKIENLKAMNTAQNETWQNVFLALGWSPYNLDVEIDYPYMPKKKVKSNPRVKRRINKR